MLGGLLPQDVCPVDPPVDVWSDPTADLDRVGFYVPVYMGPRETFELMSRMPSLQVVQLLTAGFESAQQFLPSSVTLCNAAGVHDASTAELAVALMLASLRHLDDYARAMQQGQWLHGRREALADKRVLIIGAGGVARAIEARLAPFEVELTLVGRSARPGVRGQSELPELLPHADVIVLALPLTDETLGLVDSAFLACLPDGALVVNVARGPVIDTAALLAEVSRGRLRAALDVTDPEPLPPDHPLWQAPGVLISPHVGGNTSAFLPRARRLVAEQLRRWANGEPLANVVVGGAPSR